MTTGNTKMITAIRISWRRWIGKQWRLCRLRRQREGSGILGGCCRWEGAAGAAAGGKVTHPEIESIPVKAQLGRETGSGQETLYEETGHHGRP